jgi:hypothetical protein
MKKYIPYLIILALACVIAWLLSRPAPISGLVSNEQKETPKPTREYTDANGNKQSEYDATDNTVSRKDVRNPNIPLGIVDTSAMLLKIARTQIIQVNRIASSTKDSLLQAKWEINQLKKRIVRYQDKYIDLSYTPDADTTKAGTFAFRYNNEVTVTQYHKRAKVLGLPLGSRKTYIDIMSNDPRTKINGFKSLSIEQESPIFGLRIQAGTNYNPQTGSIGVGPAARFDVGRFSVQGNYTFYPESERWRPSINATYDLIRF